jgi:hypothetical protein
MATLARSAACPTRSWPTWWAPTERPSPASSTTSSGGPHRAGTDAHPAPRPRPSDRTVRRVGYLLLSSVARVPRLRNVIKITSEGCGAALRCDR